MITNIILLLPLFYYIIAIKEKKYMHIFYFYITYSVTESIKEPRLNGPRLVNM